MSGDLLLVDDDAAIRTVIVTSLRRAGFDIRVASSLAEMERELKRARPDLLITDVVLPDGDGLDRAAALTESDPGLPIIVLSAKNTLSTAVRANEVGAFEYLPKPFDLDALTAAVRGALDRSVGDAEEQETFAEDAVPLIGRSPAMQEVYRIIARMVSNDLTVLVTGESGTGKELVAHAIHDLGHRRREPFIALNMAAIPRELIEAELFGHERGAFTGAQARVAGKFEQASGGTLFLDEIGDMPMEAQTRLLRVLQSGEFTTVGGARTIRADVRIIAATNKDLHQRVEAGQFREDLFYRLNVVPINLPALRDRRQDIALLARHFLDRAAEEGLPRKRIDPAALSLLEEHGWPGNVRELQNVMRRIAVLGRDDVIDAEEIAAMLGAGEGGSAVEPLLPTKNIADAVRAHLRHIERENPALLSNGGLYDHMIAQVERPLIETMLARHDDNQLRTAQALGINRNTLRKRLDLLGIEAGKRAETKD